jgi:hypothetical protein
VLTAAELAHFDEDVSRVRTNSMSGAGFGDISVMEYSDD